MPSHQKQVITDKVGEEIRVWVSQDQYNYAISTLEQALEPMVEYDEDQLKMESRLFNLTIWMTFLKISQIRH